MTIHKPTAAGAAFGLVTALYQIGTTLMMKSKVD
jgi:hypothetical protein